MASAQISRTSFHPMNMTHFLRGLCPLSFLILLSCASSKSEYRFEEGIAWNTSYHITYEAETDLGDSIRHYLNEIDVSLSPFNSNSLVAKINDNRSDAVDGHFVRVYEESKRINSVSSGAFDPTLGPVILAWGFGKGHEVSPDTVRIDSLLNFVGIQKTRLEDRRLVKDFKEIEFNFSALAKGYGVDCIAKMLQRNGSENFLVEIGGEIRSSGVNPKGEKWKIGIDRPDENSGYGESVEVIEVNQISLATSGNYRNYHEENGNKFGHTISPVTGRPAVSDVISATVTAESCMEADALATCCMVLGSKKALSLCSRLNAGVFLILEDFSVIQNDLFP